jgi:stearoyl-CoA desaturase (delta-9 desaturase)
MNSNIVFFITKSYWPYYHYMIPWDYQTGEYGNYGQGCTSTLIRIWAAMGSATGLRTVDTTCIRNALLTATKTGTSVTEWLNDEEKYSKQYNETEQFLEPAKSL